MRFTRGFLPWSATAYVLAFLSLGAPISHSQGSAKPKPHVSYDGPALTFDFPGVKVGVAEYEEGPTGTTVLYFPTPVVAAVDVRGGAPGTLNTDALRLAYDDPSAGVNAIVLSGGSSYGLSAATGVANALKDMITDAGNFDDVATVAGAIIFDLGDRRFNTITPDEELGRAALASARAGWFPLGARGAGRFAMQSLGWDISLHSGQGAAFRQSGDTKVLVVTVNNGGPIRKEGGSHGLATGLLTAGAGVAFWPAAPFVLLMHGKDVTVHRGIEVSVFTDQTYAMKNTGAPGAPGTRQATAYRRYLKNAACPLHPHYR